MLLICSLDKKRYICGYWYKEWCGINYLNMVVNEERMSIEWLECGCSTENGEEVKRERKTEVEGKGG